MSKDDRLIPKEEIPEPYREGFYGYSYHLGFKDATEGKPLDINSLRHLAKKSHLQDVSIKSSFVVSAFAAGWRKAKLGGKP